MELNWLPDSAAPTFSSSSKTCLQKYYRHRLRIGGWTQEDIMSAISLSRRELLATTVAVAAATLLPHTLFAAPGSDLIRPFAVNIPQGDGVMGA